jgi:hypothetical protein
VGVAEVGGDRFLEDIITCVSHQVTGCIDNKGSSFAPDDVRHQPTWAWRGRGEGGWGSAPLTAFVCRTESPGVLAKIAVPSTFGLVRHTLTTKCKR